MASLVDRALTERSRALLDEAAWEAAEWVVDMKRIDDRDIWIGLVPYIDCARRLGVDPFVALEPVLRFEPWLEPFLRREDITLAAFGWSIEEVPEGLRYAFAWPPLRAPGAPPHPK